MKVIFLDFDGVLNSRRYLLEQVTYGVNIDPTRMELLKKIIDATGAEIVLTTSWRTYWSDDSAECEETGCIINDIFAQYGLAIYGKTPDLNDDREREIEEWLLLNPDVTHFVVLDDMFLDAKFLRGHFVRTSNFKYGLEEDDVEAAIAILND